MYIPGEPVNQKSNFQKVSGLKSYYRYRYIFSGYIYMYMYIHMFVYICWRCHVQIFILIKGFLHSEFPHYINKFLYPRISIIIQRCMHNAYISSYFCFLWIVRTYMYSGGVFGYNFSINTGTRFSVFFKMVPVIFR